VPRDFHERLVVAYHGTERSIARRVLLGEAELVPSANDYDWLGHGVYFWEHGLARALDFAEAKRRRGVYEDPFVIGAYLHLGRCLDLTDVWATRHLADSYRQLRRAFARVGKPLPVNSRRVARTGDVLFRRLDCAVINNCVDAFNAEERWLGRPRGFDTVRGVFEEGDAAFPGAATRVKSHVQIAVRNPACILGVFRPTGYSV